MEQSNASGLGVRAAGAPHTYGVPEPRAQARFDSRWSWLGARTVGGGRGYIEVHVPGVPSAREAPPAEGVATVHAWQARLETMGSRDVPHELGPAARDADDLGGEELVGMRLLCAFALHLVVQPSFGATNRTWTGLLGPRGLARLTRVPEALASLTAIEPRWVLEHSVTSGERCLVTLLAEAVSPVLPPPGTFPYGAGILTSYTLDKMDEGRGDFQWVPEDKAEWSRLRAALETPRVTEEGGWLHVVFCRGELAERAGERLALMDLERHDYWLEPLSGELRGCLSACGSVVCREPSMPMIGRPFLVQRRLVTARAVARADWSA